MQEIISSSSIIPVYTLGHKVNEIGTRDEEIKSLEPPRSLSFYKLSCNVTKDTRKWNIMGNFLLPSGIIHQRMHGHTKIHMRLSCNQLWKLLSATVHVNCPLGGLGERLVYNYKFCFTSICWSWSTCCCCSRGNELNCSGVRFITCWRRADSTSGGSCTRQRKWSQWA